ncbi:YihY/virulence factor BrkB family protein [Ramlibacter sp. PS4R-6]|uniref:YihY/virulence factor BrkB family protein n=1 Tax=Ramlibacter sp. PS4R-6 TaxID=3133438 RepID=UPI00309D3572
MLSPRIAHVLKSPGSFTWTVLKQFKKNQGLLLAGAVAYYALLSIVPLLILLVMALSYFVDQALLLSTLGRYLEWLVPGQSRTVIGELHDFLTNSNVVGWVLLVTMLFFSSLAFTVLENAFSVIFLHRIQVKKRRYIVSAVLPYVYILCLGVGVLVVTLASNSLQAIGQDSIVILGHEWGLKGVSGALLYLLGLAGEILVVSSVYIAMPVGRLPWRHALIGGATAAVLWEITRHILAWYFSTLSKVSVVYGSLTTSIIVLFSLEIGATLLLLGAQVISEYERIGLPEPPDVPNPFRETQS